MKTMRQTIFAAVLSIAGLLAQGQAEFEPNGTILQNSASNTFTAPVNIAADITFSPDDRDFFRIDLPYCGSWSFTILNPNGTPCILKMFIYNAQNTANVIINGGGIDFNFNNGIPAPVIVNAGQTLYVQIDQTSGPNLGAYTLSVQPTPNADPFECNNNFSEAKTLPIDTTVSIKLFGFDRTGAPDADFFQTTAPRCGVLNITASNIGGGGNTDQDIQIWVYQPNSAVEIGSAGTGNPFPCNLTFTSESFLVQPGPVFIKIDDRTTGYNCHGGYQLSNTPFNLTFQFDTSDVCECNNTFGTACEVPINSSHNIKLWGINSKISYLGSEDRDIYKVVAPRCGVLNITADNIGGGTTDQDIQFTVYQPDSITEIGSAGTGNPFPCNLTSISESFLVQPGPVFIKIDDRTTGYNCQGGYQLSNTPFNLTFQFDTTDQCECNNTFTDACSVAVPDTFQFTVRGLNNLNFYGGNDYDFFKIVANNCGTANFNISGINPGYQLRVRVYNDTTNINAPLTNVTVNGPNPISVTFQVNKGDVRYVLVTQSSNSTAVSSTLNAALTFTPNGPPAPVVTPAGPVSICPGQSVTLTSNATGSHKWTTGATTASITVTTAGVYRDTTYDGQGCFAVSNAVVVTTSPAPTANFTIGSINGKQVSFNNSSSAATSYLWLFGDGNSSASTNPQHTYANNGSYTVRLIAIGNCGQDTTEAIVNIAGVGVAEIYEALKITIHPNPATTQLNITTNAAINNIAIYNINGQKLSEQTFSEQIDISALTPGIYFVELTTPQGQVRRKRWVKM